MMSPTGDLFVGDVSFYTLLCIALTVLHLLTRSDSELVQCVVALSCLQYFLCYHNS